MSPSPRLLFALAVLMARGAAAQTPKSPLLVLLGGDTKTWQAACAERGWQFLEPPADSAGKSADQRIKALAAAVEDTGKRLPVDANRVYLAAQGASVSTLFYVAARMPDLWAAAAAIGGSPRGPRRFSNGWPRISVIRSLPPRIARPAALCSHAAIGWK